MSVNPERIGRAEVIEVQQENGFTIKRLSPEMVEGPLEVGSEEAMLVLSSMREIFTKKGKRKAYNIHGREQFTDNIR